IRQALAQGNRPGDAAPLEPRGETGYQGGGPDPVARFRDELATAGGFPHLVADVTEAAEQVLTLVRQRSARRVLMGSGTVIDKLPLRHPFREHAVQVPPVM